ncbi:hypothetical protein CBL_02776 [Carabus blaptoides fortunei]
MDILIILETHLAMIQELIMDTMDVLVLLPPRRLQQILNKAIMHILFNICYLLAVASAGLVYPSNYGQDLQAKIEHFLAKAQAEAQHAYGDDNQHQYAGFGNAHVYGDYGASSNTYGHNHDW